MMILHPRNTPIHAGMARTSIGKLYILITSNMHNLLMNINETFQFNLFIAILCLVL